jgi:hypothetical protein
MPLEPAILSMLCPHSFETASRVNKASLAVRGTMCVASFLLVAGCNTPRIADTVAGPSYRPQNVHCFSDRLAFDIRRVAVLPVTGDAAPHEIEAGRDLLGPILSDELGKTKKFELIPVSPEKLRQWTGRTSWAAEERLPADFFKMLRDELGCEAVLFCRVTQFHAYPPLAVGLQFKLVDARLLHLLWVADEVIDAAEPSVVNGARRYQQAQEQRSLALADSRSILNSPRGFSHYAARTLFATLPER